MSPHSFFFWRSQKSIETLRPTGSMRPLVLGSPCVCPKQILFLLSKKCLTCRVVFRPSLVLCGQPPSCQGSRVVCHVQPRTLDPGTVTRKRDTDCDSFASFVSPSHLPIVRVCGVFYFISDFSHVSFLAHLCGCRSL